MVTYFSHFKTNSLSVGQRCINVWLLDKREFHGGRVFLLAVISLFFSAASFASNSFMTTKLIGGEGAANDFFGASLVLSENTALITGKGGDSGSVHAFVRNSDTDFLNEQDKLTVSGLEDGEFFGHSMAVSGDTAVIGVGSDSHEGSAYVFIRNPDTGHWSEEFKLMASDGAIGNEFGKAVVLVEDTILIGASGDDDNGPDSGSVYVFVRDPSTGVWVEQPKLTSRDGVAGDRFGHSLALSGNTVLIGAVNDDDLGRDSGAAYIFTRDESTSLWSEQAKLTASDGNYWRKFGHSVSLSGDTALIGEVYDDIKGSASGSGYIFVRDPTTGLWAEQVKLETDSGYGNSPFRGKAVALSGDAALISIFNSGGLPHRSGWVYFFSRDPANGLWTERTKLQARQEGKSIGDGFAYSLALWEGTALIGAPFDDALLYGVGGKSGSVYVFQLDNEGPVSHSVNINPSSVLSNTPLSFTAIVDDRSFPKL